MPTRRPTDPKPCAAPGDGRLAQVRSTRVQLALELDPAIYEPGAIARSAQAFGGLARIVVHSRKTRQVVYFAGVEADVRARLLDEFTNYALGCMVVEP